MDLKLELATAEFIVLVGPSGCGKKTALKMIAGLSRTQRWGSADESAEVVNQLTARRDPGDIPPMVIPETFTRNYPEQGPCGRIWRSRFKVSAHAAATRSTRRVCGERGRRPDLSSPST